MKYLFNFRTFERFDVNNLPNNIIILTSLSEKWKSGKIFLFDTDLEKVIGFVVFDQFVDRITSDNGYGAFLYETAMTFRYPEGISMSREGSTSKEAVSVWEKFNEREDVKKQRMNYSGDTYKKKKGVQQHILDLEDTIFIYSYGKDKLEKLIEQGNKYMIDNDISEYDLDNMEINIDFDEDEL